MRRNGRGKEKEREMRLWLLSKGMKGTRSAVRHTSGRKDHLANKKLTIQMFHLWLSTPFRHVKLWSVWLPPCLNNITLWFLYLAAYKIYVHIGGDKECNKENEDPIEMNNWLHRVKHINHVSKTPMSKPPKYQVMLVLNKDEILIFPFTLCICVHPRHQHWMTSR